MGEDSRLLGQGEDIGHLQWLIVRMHVKVGELPQRNSNAELPSGTAIPRFILLDARQRYSLYQRRVLMQVLPGYDHKRRWAIWMKLLSTRHMFFWDVHPEHMPTQHARYELVPPTLAPR